VPRRKIPAEVLAFFREFGRHMGAYYPSMLSLDVFRFVTYYDRLTVFGWILSRSTYTGDADKIPAKVEYSRSDTSIDEEIGDRVPYWYPPVAGNVRVLVDQEEFDKLYKWLAVVSDTLNQSLSSGSVSDLPETSGETETEIALQLVRGDIPVKANEAVAVNTLLNRSIASKYYYIGSGLWGYTRITEYSSKTASRVSEDYARYQSLYQSLAPEIRKYSLALRRLGDLIGLIDGFTDKPGPRRILSVSDVTEDLAGYYVIVYGTVKSTSSTGIVLADQAYTVIVVTDGSSDLEVWVTPSYETASSRFYSGRKVFVGGLVDTDPYLHLLVENTDYIVLFD